MPEIQAVQLPLSPLYRIGRLPDPFALPDWQYARPDGTFAGRFDDPRGRKGLPIPDRYRVLYVASHPSGAFGESIAQYRPSLKVLARGLSNGPAGFLPRDWRIGRRFGAAVVYAAYPIADLDAAESIQALRPILASIAASLRLSDIDLSAIVGPRRELTQEAALYIYEQISTAGQPAYAGIRYRSRLNSEWECWALFADRLRLRLLRVDPIAADDPHLYEAARLLGLGIEDDRGIIVPS